MHLTNNGITCMIFISLMIDFLTKISAPFPVMLWVPRRESECTECLWLYASSCNLWTRRTQRKSADLYWTTYRGN